jgi:hypothetical protein
MVSDTFTTKKMAIIKSYQSGWKKVWKNKKMWGLLYLLNFVFALLSAVPFSGFLSKSVGHTLENSNMLNGFDYTFISDLMREYGSGLSVIMSLSQGIIVLFFIFSIFWMGGILSILKLEDNDYSFRKFWQGSAIYFWRLIRLTFYFTFFQALLLGVFAFIFIQQGINPLEVESEVTIINSLMFLVPIYLLFATIIFMIQDYAKIHIVHQKKKVIFQSIKKAFSFVIKNFRKCFGLYLLNLLTFAVFFGTYWLLSNSFNSNSTPTIFLLFFIGQAFIFSRIAVKLLNLGSAIELFRSESKSN